MPRLFLIGVIYAGLSVVLGSMGAHALKTTLALHSSAGVFEIGHDYLAYHGLALMLIALAEQRWQHLRAERAGSLIAIGAAVFSSALLLFSVTGIKWLSHFAPVGGGLMILGWLWLTWRVFHSVR
ncbi:MAG: DUF423 domain-containing protein [Pseudomonadota bacterium]